MGIASHGSIILSRARLVTVEAPGYPRHPSSIQHDAVVNRCNRLWPLMTALALCWRVLQCFLIIIIINNYNNNNNDDKKGIDLLFIP